MTLKLVFLASFPVSSPERQLLLVAAPRRFMDLKEPILGINPAHGPAQ